MESYGPFELNRADQGSFSWVMTEQHVSQFYFLIYYSEPFYFGKVRITNAMVLADRKVTVVRRVEGRNEGLQRK